jgi:hypothetical protein
MKMARAAFTLVVMLGALIAFVALGILLNIAKPFVPERGDHMRDATSYSAAPTARGRLCSEQHPRD